MAVERERERAVRKNITGFFFFFLNHLQDKYHTTCHDISLFA
jgi:hypothetical protein